MKNKAFSDWYDSLPDGEPSYQQTFEAGQAAALKAQPVQPARPCKVGGDCVAGENSACACSELSEPNPPVMQPVQPAPLTDTIDLPRHLVREWEVRLRSNLLESFANELAHELARTGGAG